MRRPQVNSIEPIRFSQMIPPGEELELVENVKAKGTIIAIDGKFYQGQKLGLQLRPRVYANGTVPIDLVTYPNNTRAFLCGNDEDFHYSPCVEVYDDDVIKIKCKNTTAFPVNVSITITIDYYFGNERVI